MRRSVCIIMLVLAPPVCADATLRDAVERAWARQPASQAQPARAEEFAAKRDAAQALFPEPPSLSVGNRNDRLNRNQGQREWEAGVALPLWLPGEQRRQSAIVSAERDQYGTALAAAKLKVAGEVRDGYWQARLAENELALAQRKVEEAAVLAADVERRVKAGDLARVDLNQALVVKENALTVYVTGAKDAKVATKGANGSATVLTGKNIVNVKLEPAGENALAGSAKFESAPDMKVVVSLTLPGQSPMQARFTPLEKAKAGK